MPLTAAEQDAIYATLSDDKKHAIDNAMVYFSEDNYLEVISSITNDCEKSGFRPNSPIVMILQPYRASPEYFREGLIRFVATW